MRRSSVEGYGLVWEVREKRKRRDINKGNGEFK